MTAVVCGAKYVSSSTTFLLKLGVCKQTQPKGQSQTPDDGQPAQLQLK